MQINWVLYDRDIGSVHVFTQFSPPFPPFCWGGWVCFFDVQKRIAFKNSLYLCLHPRIIKLFRFAELRFRTEEKIHTKAIVDVSGGGRMGKVW